MYRAHEGDKGAHNAFREIEKKYRFSIQDGNKKKKNKDNSTDFRDVVDFTNSPDVNPLIKRCNSSFITSKYFGEVRYIYELESVPGLYFIPNPFTPEQQKFWIKKCIKDYTIGNPTNISNLNNTEPWTDWQYDKMSELRWTALGYHYQWTQRIYTEDKRGPFPQELSELVSDLASVSNNSIVAEAAIINYYPHHKCQMGAHVDDAEDEMGKPIVSVSFGNSVVFLIGGRTRDIVPTALFIRSGDIVIMSGEARYCYHSVPRMIENSVPDILLQDQETDSEEWCLCKQYIANARINMNCRQVRYVPANVNIPNKN